MQWHTFFFYRSYPYKSRLKHSAAELQTIQQFGLQMDIVSEQKGKLQMLMRGSEVKHAETPNFPYYVCQQVVLKFAVFLHVLLLYY